MRQPIQFDRLALCLLAALVGLATSGCLRPSQERAEQDARVGSAEADGTQLTVAQGHAAVRELTAEQATLWTSAPSIEMALLFDGEPPDTFELLVLNCVPSAQLIVESAVAERLSQELPTRCLFRLSNLAADVSLSLSPPDAAEAAPFRFAVMSDVQEAIDDVQDIYRVVNAQEDVEFLLGAGDLTEDGERSQLVRFERELEGLNVPYYTTLGNHELGVSPTLYHEFFGRGNFSFTHRGVRFTLLDSGSATIDPIVYDWLDNWLAAGADQAHLVAMHIPPMDPVGVRNGAFASRNEAAKLLGKLAQARVDITLYGHIHSYYNFDNAGIPAHISGGGGAIPEQFDGLGRHILVIDAEPSTQRFDVSVVEVSE